MCDENNIKLKLLVHKNRDKSYLKEKSLYKVIEPTMKRYYSVFISFNDDEAAHIKNEENVLDFFFSYNIIDILSIKKLDYIDNGYQITFKSAESAHILKKFPNIKIITTDTLPQNSKIPKVYIQGIPLEATDDEIKSFFSKLCKILNIKNVETEGSFDRRRVIVTVPSVRCAKLLAEKGNGEKFNQNTLTVSLQYKSTITDCFYVNCGVVGNVELEFVRKEVLIFGKIVHIFEKYIGGVNSVLVKMENRKTAKLACGFLNKRTYYNSVLSAVFIDSVFLDQLYNFH